MKWYADYVGIPFRSLGRTRKGCDCYGLLQIVFKEHYNLTLPDVIGYKDAMNTDQTSHIIEEYTPLLAGEKEVEPKEGMVVVLNGLEGLSSHVGVLISDKLMLHTTKRFGTIIEDLSIYKNRVKGFYNVNKSYSTNRPI